MFLARLSLRLRLRKKPRRELPRLPPEIWVAIMRCAAEPSGPFTGPHGRLDSPVSFLDVSSDHADLLRRLAVYRAALGCKATMSRVCRHWHLWAQELLYEFIWISRARQARALAAALALNNDLGPCIRRLHIETFTLERCDPGDLRTIIEHAPRLAAYSDYRSIRRQPYSSPDHLLASLARPGNTLKRLSWTNYDYDRRDQSGCISFFLRLSPALGRTASELDYLELSLCATNLVKPQLPTSALSPVIPVDLPALRTLKLTLDNITFSVLSHWTLPSLQNLSVLSTDFSYTGDGFALFFQVHGHNIVQLELGHSTGAIEEYYLTSHAVHRLQPSPSSNLAAWCPNLREFICSAHAEWNWQSPDWIAPHLLLPAHPNLRLIAVRDMNKRLLDDLELFLVRRSDRLRPGHGPFFRLAEQIRSLLRSDAFPQLQIIRDMSWESALMRRVQRMPLPQDPMRFDVWDMLPHSTNLDEIDFGKSLSAFWKNVGDNCATRGVQVQDWTGQTCYTN
ncbi:hypothetical protein Agabi119p4_10034 [Agaricus bisporus var. burnettii]|uniref:Uncharacterized protein n=1 Tax=Agaricus bisporus var. burnettii TaxID=192524 RepID=A0A8H7C258_AGABI|nr:hypothetical protein Agabi119p4_10034 [Agaricus bisporus var. burnettii]